MVFCLLWNGVWSAIILNQTASTDGMVEGHELAGGAGAFAAAGSGAGRDGVHCGRHPEAGTADDVWKYWIVSAFAPGLSPKNQQKLKEKIRRIACQPTPGEHAEEVDEVAKAYLSEHA